jgi:FAD:protein FMN transferase
MIGPSSSSPQGGSRRRRLIGLAVALLVFVATLVVLSIGDSSGSTGPVSDSTQLLGTILHITIHDGGYDERLIERAFDRVAEIERRMSTSEDDYETTELLAVNRAAGRESVVVSADTFGVLQSAREFSDLTAGAFDVTIWPLVRLWGIGSHGTSVPDEDRIAAAQDLVDYRRLQLEPEERRVALPESGMGVDVGAIAKGYAADEAAGILREAGVEHALLDFGGNILVIGDKPDGSPWRIGIQRPDAERTRFLGILSVVDRTVVTSGPYERFFVEDGVRYHHILDVSTGYPARNGLHQVSIVATRSIDADALSTATFVLGREAGMRLIESLPDVEAVFVTDDREVYLTSGAVELFSLTDEEYRIATPSGD